MMFGCWRKVDAADPDTFITAVAAVLSGYPEHVVYLVTDPRTGLPSKQQFPPSAFEVRQECEKHMENVRWHQDRDRRLESQKLLAIAPPERPRKTYEELKAEFGGNWGIAGELRFVEDERFMSDDQVKAKLEKILSDLAAKVTPAPQLSEAMRRKLKSEGVIPSSTHPATDRAA